MRQRNLTDWKLCNRAHVLQCVCEAPGVTRQEIAEALGLSKMAVANIISEYVEQGFVRERYGPDVESGSRNAGRPAHRVYIVPESLFVLGVCISEGELTCALVDFACRPRLISRAVPDTREDNERLLDKLDQLIDRVLEDGAAHRESIVGIGVSAVGLIDDAGGRIFAADNYPNVRDLHIREHFQSRYDLPVLLANDMDASALAERYYGQAVGADSFVYMGVNNCIGLGLYINGALYRGYHGYSGEIGYTTINYMGSDSPFGYRGRLESYVRIDRFVKQVNEDVRSGAPGVPSFGESPVEWRHIVARAQEGDPYCLDVIHRLGDYVAIALVNVMNLFDPEKIVLGGQISAAGELIRGYLLERTRGLSLAAHFFRDEQVPLELSHFRELAGIAGAGALFFDKLFHGHPGRQGRRPPAAATERRTSGPTY